MKAFPAYEWNESHKQMMAVGGMNLRDYFAAKALTGLLTEASGDYEDEAIAELSYNLADAMMKAREAK